MGKVIAVIDRPKNCQNCWFGICKYSAPLTEYNKGYYCQLKDPKDRVIENFDYGADVHLSGCPLREVKKITSDNLLDEYSDGYDDGWNACIDDILKGENDG